jgi:DNA-binding MarR family transcriptional regulator
MSSFGRTIAKSKTETDLSQNEARVLHSLVKWPNLTDQAIHSQIGMKKSTFSSIKTRLKDHNYYKRFFVPNFPLVGFEMLMVMHGQLNRFTTFEERMRIAKNLLESFVEDFHVVSESNKAFNLSVTQNYTEYAKNQEKFFHLYSENKFLSKKGMETIAYPFELTRVHSFMDYESLIARLFGFASESYENRISVPSGSVNQVKLTRAERKVLVGLVQFPEESDTLIAENIGVSRNTVANAKRKFLAKGICFPRVVPNLTKLGLKILNFSFRRFNPKVTMDERGEASDIIRKKLSPHFYVSKNLDGFVISAHVSFEDFSTANDEIMNYYMKHEYILEEPVNYQISIPDMAILKEFEFLPMTLKILGFDPEKPLVDQ